MLKPRINDIVRILCYSNDDPNAFARVTEVLENGIKVCNMNQPFQGTLDNVFYRPDEFNLWHKESVRRYFGLKV